MAVLSVGRRMGASGFEAARQAAARRLGRTANGSWLTPGME